MRIVQFSDPHAGGPAEDWLAYLDKRWVGVFNYRFRRKFRHDLHKLELAVSYILEHRPDLAVCTGDLTSSGQPGEFEMVRKILEPLRNSSIPLIYMPGNHDCYVKRPRCVKAVRDMVDYLSHGAYQFSDMPLVRRCCGVDFLLLNCSRPSNLLCSWGFVDPADAAWVEARCAEPKNGPRVLLSHYPMQEEHPILRVRHRLFGQQKIVRAMRSGAIDLVLCGHVHRPFQHVDRQGHGEVCAGSVTRNGTILEIECDPGTAAFQFKTIELA